MISYWLDQKTTATNLSTALFLLCQNPYHIHSQLEIRTTPPAESASNIVAVNQLKYDLAVLDETMRIFPPAPNIDFVRVINNEGDIVTVFWVGRGQHLILRSASNDRWLIDL